MKMSDHYLLSRQISKPCQTEQGDDRGKSFDFFCHLLRWSLQIQRHSFLVANKGLAFSNLEGSGSLKPA